MDAIWQTMSGWATLYGLKVIGALAILILGRIVVGIITGALGRLMKKSKTDETLGRFFKSVVKISLLVVVVIMALGNLGIQTTSFVAIIGAAGLAVGLALQGSLSNFGSGVLIIIFRPFKAGDFVETGGSSGTVEEITIFNTVLKTPDNKIVIIPNSGVAGNNIVNYSAMDTRRIDMVFGIGYNDDLKQAKSILDGLLREDRRILADPKPLVAVFELADNSVNLVVRPWVKATDYWDVYFDITEKVKLTFDARGISIPYPQRDIHLYQTTAK